MAKKYRLPTPPVPCQVMNCRAPATHRGIYFAGGESRELWICPRCQQRSKQNREDHNWLFDAALRAAGL